MCYLISSSYLYFLLYSVFISSHHFSYSLTNILKCHDSSFHYAPWQNPSPDEPNFALPWAYVLRSGRRKLKVHILPPRLDSQGCQKGRRLQLTKHCRTSSQSIPYPLFTSLSRRGSWLDLIPWQLKAVIWYRSRTPGPCLCVFNEERLRN